jgi:hypothetical protein
MSAEIPRINILEKPVPRGTPFGNRVLEWHMNGPNVHYVCDQVVFHEVFSVDVRSSGLAYILLIQ